MRDHICIYLDESGDLGFNFDKKRTPRYFIITLLVCHNQAAVTHFKRAIRKTYKTKLSVAQSDIRELKGTKTICAIKKYFYRQISHIKDWHLYGIVLDKHLLKKKLGGVLPSEQRIYNHLSKEVLAQVDLSSIKSQLLLVVDKRKGKEGINEFNKYLSNHLEATLPLNIAYDISHERSHENPILQAVDMFCWGIGRHYEHDDQEWLSVYKDRLTIMELNDFGGIK